MAKLNTFTTYAIALFFLGLFATWTSPLIIGDSWIEKIYSEHQGYFWLLGLGFGAIIIIIQLFNIRHQKDVKDKENELIECAKKAQLLEIKIEKQNKSIIENQLIYIERLDAIHKTINDNSDKDNRAWDAIRKHDEQLIEMRTLIKKIERLVIDHDNAIDKLKN